MSFIIFFHIFSHSTTDSGMYKCVVSNVFPFSHRNSDAKLCALSADSNRNNCSPRNHFHTFMNSSRHYILSIIRHTKNTVFNSQTSTEIRYETDLPLLLYISCASDTNFSDNSNTNMTVSNAISFAPDNAQLKH